MSSFDSQQFRCIRPAEAGLQSANTTAITPFSASTHVEALLPSFPYPSLTWRNRNPASVNTAGTSFLR
ncbi:hypothetical protein VDGL01_12067 [Verticillium dahliae]